MGYEIFPHSGRRISKSGIEYRHFWLQGSLLSALEVIQSSVKAKEDPLQSHKEREQNVVFWLKIELEIGTNSKSVLQRCISHSQIHNCVMAILSDFFSWSLAGIITTKKSAIKGSKCSSKEMSCVVNRMSSEKNPILEIKLNMK